MPTRLKLHWSPKSPYVRKVMIAAHELGLMDRLDLVRNVAAMSTVNRGIMMDNPLGKIPVLVTESEGAIYDSLVICEYFDTITTSPCLFPRDPRERIGALTRHALANGLLDLLVLWRNERDKSPERQTPEWLEAFAEKTNAALDRMEEVVTSFRAGDIGIAELTFGAALGYADYRFAALGWRDRRPALTRWYETFAARPSMMKTVATDG